MADQTPTAPAEWDELVAQLIHSLRQEAALRAYVRDLEAEVCTLRADNARLRGLAIQPASALAG